MCDFYLGTHRACWLWQTTIPLFVSRRQLAPRHTVKKATCRWALDSGGFSELSLFGRWETTATEYAGEVARWSTEIGGLDFAAAQDWMCEPWILEKTGLSVAEHQERTVANYLELRNLAPELPWVPVLQGWHHDDYLSHMEQYHASGVRLADLPRVGIGSVCRRQDTGMVEGLIRELAGAGLRLHGFGFKLRGLANVADVLASADSMAWSYAARRTPPLSGCVGHKNCANCYRFAERWYSRVCRVVEHGRRREVQGVLF